MLTLELSHGSTRSFSTFLFKKKKKKDYIVHVKLQIFPIGIKNFILIGNWP